MQSVSRVLTVRRRLLLQGASHVGRTEEVLGDLDHQLAHGLVPVGGQEFHHRVEILHVLLREARIALFKGGSAEHEPEKGDEKYEDAFHSQKKASR